MENRFAASMLTPDPLIIAAKKFLNSKDAGSYNHVGMVECKGHGLDIRATPGNVERALAFMDNVIKALNAKQYEISFRNSETYVVVRGVEIKIKCHELSKRVTMTDRNWNRTELHPTGILCFKTGSHSTRDWKDSVSDPSRRVENFIPDIIAWLEGEADYWNNCWEENRLRQEAADRKRQAAERIQEIKRAELFAFEELLNHSERWHKANRLRAYINEHERQGADWDWVHWARNKADWYDPFTESADELLGQFTDSQK